MYGIKVAKPGKDITSRDKDITLDTSINMFKFYKQGTVALTIPAYDGVTGVGSSFSIKHGLKYIPSLFLFFKGKTGKWGQLQPLSQSINWSVDFPYAGKQGVSANSIDLNIFFNNYPDTATAYPEHKLILNYIIMYEELGE